MRMRLATRYHCFLLTFSLSCYTWHIPVADFNLVDLIIHLSYILPHAGKAVVSKTDSEVVYEEPDFSQLKESKKALDIKLEECPAYGTAKKDQNIELEECPAYGSLRH